jgi:CD109 antigen
MDKLSFVGQKDLLYLSKHFSIFIQSDKAIYKANDVIRFRLFAINSHSLPYSINSLTEITINDPSNNKIKQYSNVTFIKGKYENELLLSNSPKVGSWSIVVEAEGEVRLMNSLK